MRPSDGLRRAGCIAAVIALAGCTRLPPGEPAAPRRDFRGEAADRVTQVSLINSLMLGRYDGELTIAELLAAGDFGLGTLDRLDGELVVLDGEAWQVTGEGEVRRVDPTTTTPFAVVTPFAADAELPCPRAESLSDLEVAIDAAVARSGNDHANNFLAVRVDATLATVRLRSVRRQEKPYRPLAEVAREQAEWSHADASGTLVGLRCPAWTRGLNVPGWHWHFLSGDRRVGGHVLELAVREGRLTYDACGEWLVRLGQSEAFNAAAVDRDLSGEVEAVERQRR